MRPVWWVVKANRWDKGGGLGNRLIREPGLQSGRHIFMDNMWMNSSYMMKPSVGEKCLEYLPLKLGGLTISWRNRKESFLPLGSSPLLACEILHILTHICLFYFIDIY